MERFDPLRQFHTSGGAISAHAAESNSPATHVTVSARVSTTIKEARARMRYPARALVEPEIGFEPTTYALRVRCSTGLSYPGGGAES